MDPTERALKQVTTSQIEAALPTAQLSSACSCSLIDVLMLVSSHDNPFTTQGQYTGNGCIEAALAMLSKATQPPRKPRPAMLSEHSPASAASRKAQDPAPFSWRKPVAEGWP
jgi:hypothetical protein